MLTVASKTINLFDDDGNEIGENHVHFCEKYLLTENKFRMSGMQRICVLLVVAAATFLFRFHVQYVE